MTSIAKCDDWHWDGLSVSGVYFIPIYLYQGFSYINIYFMKTLSIFVLLFFLFFTVTAQTSPNRMDFEEYEPKSTLVVPQHLLTHAKFPFFDVHNHQWDVPDQDISQLFSEMDKLHMAVMNNLSGKSYKESSGRNGEFDVQGNDYLVKSLKHIAQTNAKRLTLFTNISFVGFGEKGWTEKAVKELEKDVLSGARGLKIYKDLGLRFKDEKNQFIRIDDPRLDAIWDKCGALHIPVLIHSADPKSFWDPVDKNNERWLEVTTHPDRSYYQKGLPSWETLITEQHAVFQKHPHTIFIAAHFGWLANNLSALDSLLSRLPNVYVEFGAVIAEIGRQPASAKKFFEKYQDRILFGKDSWVPSEYATYFRVLETTDEYFPYHKKYHAFWRMYGLGLSDSILKKIYYRNALRIIPGIDKNLFPE
ncbi:MAG TPA: amidohydrolase family protein [Puia sp.]|nr:amidohydrolase family protein [Puia sp.]